MYNNIPTMYNHITHPLVRSRVILVIQQYAVARRPAKFPKSCMHGDMQVACMPSLQFEPATAAAVARFNLLPLPPSLRGGVHPPISTSPAGV